MTKEGIQPDFSEGGGVIPRREGDGIPGSIEESLNILANQWGSELDREALAGQPAADILYERLCHIATEESWAWNDESRQTLDNVIAAYGIVAFPFMSSSQQVAFNDGFNEMITDSPEMRKSVELTPEQAQILERVAARAGVAFDATQTSVARISILKPGTGLDTNENRQRLRRLTDDEPKT